MKPTILKAQSTQMEVYKSIRKPLAGPSLAHVDRKNQYRRPQGNWGKWTND